MAGDIVIVVPVLRRPARVAPLIASVAVATPEPYRLLFVATEDDTEELAALKMAGADFIVLPGERQPADYARKIQAGLEASDEPLIFTGADDLVFHPGWLAAARRRLTVASDWIEDPWQPDARIGVVGTNDLGNADVISGKSSTHSVVTRAYVEEFGTLETPGQLYSLAYDHNFCDVEFVETAKIRSAFVHAPDSVVEHLHPSWEKAETDEVYELGRAMWWADAKMWRRRRRAIRSRARELGRELGRLDPAQELAQELP